MPKLEVEVSDDGKIGTLPPELQAFFEQRGNEFFRKGAEKAAKDADAKLEEAVKKAREEERAAAKGGDSAAEKERLKTLEEELSRRREEDAKRANDYETAKKEIETRHKSTLDERDRQIAEEREMVKKELAKRDQRIRESVDADIRVAAMRSGTRDASLDEVGELLSKFVVIDGDLRPSVDVAAFRTKFEGSKLGGDDGKTAVTIEGLVTEYLSLKPHHKAPPTGKGGGARGGLSTAGSTSKNPDKDAAFDAVAENPGVDTAAAAFAQIGR